MTHYYPIMFRCDFFIINNKSFPHFCNKEFKELDTIIIHQEKKHKIIIK